MFFQKLLFVTIISLIFMGCSSYTKKQCKDLDWSKVGLSQAYEGVPLNDGLSYYYTSCTLKNQVEINKSEFKKGYQYGLEQFCNPDNAAIWGLEGKSYKGICPKKKEKRFMASYNRGYHQYLSGKVASLSGTVQSLEAEIARLKKEISLKNSKINALESKRTAGNSNL